MLGMVSNGGATPRRGARLRCSLFPRTSVKIILSRKGFDSSYGGVPSPIFEDGRLFPLPIPERPLRSIVRYADLRFSGIDIGALVESLTGSRVKAGSPCHLDPDLDRGTRHRISGWKPALGQVSASLRHLINRRVGPGDLFLFFGWFRGVSARGKKGWRYLPASPHLHQLFGWLQVDEIIEIGTVNKALRRRYHELTGHPHFHPRFMDGRNGSNAVFVGAERLSVPGVPAGLPGAGFFPQAHESLTLTERRQSCRSLWRLPGWFLSPQGEPRLSYHGRRTRWRCAGRDVVLRSAPIGQEFVCDTQFAPEAISWLVELFGHA